MADVPNTQSNTNAQDVLKNISQGDVEIDKLIRFVKEGHKLDNFAIRKLIEKLRTENGFDDSTILNIYLELDKLVEEGQISNEVIDSLKLK